MDAAELLISRYQNIRIDLLRQLELLETGQLKTTEGALDTTEQSIAALKTQIGQIEAQLFELSKHPISDGAIVEMTLGKG